MSLGEADSRKFKIALLERRSQMYRIVGPQSVLAHELHYLLSEERCDTTVAEITSHGLLYRLLFALVAPVQPHILQAREPNLCPEHQALRVNQDLASAGLSAMSEVAEYLSDTSSYTMSIVLYKAYRPRLTTNV
jgi:hypothetical protein